jgi:hypothetical protein
MRRARSSVSTIGSASRKSIAVLLAAVPAFKSWRAPKTSVVVCKVRVALLTQEPSACWLDVRKVAPSSNRLAWLNEGTSRRNSAKIANLSVEEREVRRLTVRQNTIWFKAENLHDFMRNSCVIMHLFMY